MALYVGQVNGSYSGVGSYGKGGRKGVADFSGGQFGANGAFSITNDANGNTRTYTPLVGADGKPMLDASGQQEYVLTWTTPSGVTHTAKGVYDMSQGPDGVDTFSRDKGA